MLAASKSRSEKSCEKLSPGTRARRIGRMPLIMPVYRSEGDGLVRHCQAALRDISAQSAAINASRVTFKISNFHFLLSSFAVPKPDASTAKAQSTATNKTPTRENFQFPISNFCFL